MISIVTPANRVLPWQNLRLINVCSQDFENWEWIILDNSKNGCFKEYVERFFVEMQGVYYKHCKDKIKVYHEPLDGVTVENGRFGIMRNRCIDLVSYDGDCDVILVLDSDDFLYDGALSRIQNAVDTHKDSELFTGMRSWSLCQDVIENVIEYHNTELMTFSLQNDSRPIKMLEDVGFCGVGYSEYREKYLNGDIKLRQMVRRKDFVTFPCLDYRFESNFVTFEYNQAWSFLASAAQPLAFKKKAFADKIGGYCTSCACEDIIYYLMPHRLKRPVFINHPLIMICTVCCGELFCSATNDVIENTDETNKLYEAVRVGNYLDRYNFTKDCMQVIKPIIYE